MTGEDAAEVLPLAEGGVLLTESGGYCLLHEDPECLHQLVGSTHLKEAS